jgi:hypothetical protein
MQNSGIDRRAFLRSLIGGVAAAAAVRTWPFRVFSFPAEVKPIPVVIGQWNEHGPHFPPLTIENLRAMKSQLMAPAIHPEIYRQMFPTPLGDAIRLTDRG